ncbi:unnamed protein product [Heterosigma akashiwo]
MVFRARCLLLIFVIAVITQSGFAFRFSGSWIQHSDRLGWTPAAHPFRQSLNRRRLLFAQSDDKDMQLTQLPIVPIASALEAGLAVVAGHAPGVVVGLVSLAWSTVLKNKDAVRRLLPVSPEAVGTPLSVWVVALLGVRLATLAPDARYAGAFPKDVAAPIGCTRVAGDFGRWPGGGNLRPAVVPGLSVDQVQQRIKGWILEQPRATILEEKEGYIHAQVLSNLMGFPDNLGVRVFRNAAGRTEVWAQGELRVGQGDLGVNYAR